MTEPATFPERPRVAVACGCALGESPVWDARTGTLFWVDIKDHALWSWRPGGDAQARRLPVPDQIGFVQLLADPDHVVVGLRSGLARLALASGAVETLLRPEPDRPGNRLNDSCLGPGGTLYFGSMDDAEAEPTGRFYRWDAGGLHAFGEPAVITNGPAYDPARHCLYTTDTVAGRVSRRALDPDGTPGAPHLFAQFGEGDGHPDGMAVDRESHLWVCHWGAGRITRFSPDGQPVLVVPMPTAQVSSLAFGGSNLRTAYVTSAARGRDRTIDLLAGHVFAFEPGVAGLPAGACTPGRLDPA